MSHFTFHFHPIRRFWYIRGSTRDIQEYKSIFQKAEGKFNRDENVWVFPRLQNRPHLISQLCDRINQHLDVYLDRYLEELLMKNPGDSYYIRAQIEQARKELEEFAASLPDNVEHLSPPEYLPLPPEKERSTFLKNQLTFKEHQPEWLPTWRTMEKQYVRVSTAGITFHRFQSEALEGASIEDYVAPVWEECGTGFY